MKRTALFLLAFCALLLVLPALIPASSTEIELAAGNAAPSPSHPFGTDLKGRDLFVRVAEGARLSLLIGLAATLVSSTIGIAWGAIAGYRGGRIDAVMMRTVDILYGLPFMFIVIILLSLTGRSVLILFAALGFVEWLTMARVVRAEVRLLASADFVTAARALGARQSRILFRHVLPNAGDTILVYTTFTVPAVILEEAFLSFLGLGVPAPEASLGTLIREGIVTLSVYPWQLLFPALVLLAIIFTINLFGNRLKRTLTHRPL